MRINYKIDWVALGEVEGSKKLSSKKYQILESGLKILAKRGVMGLTVTALSKESHLSKPLVLYHYESMDKVFEDLYFFHTKLLEYFLKSAHDQERSYEENITLTTVALIKWSLFNREVAEFICLMPHISQKTQLLKKYTEQRHQLLQDHYEKIFMESFRFKSVESIKIVTRGVRSLTMGTLTSMISHGEISQHDEYLTQLKFNLEQFLQVELPRFNL